jgi:hypothetical protein
MGAKRVASAAGTTAALVYVALSGRLSSASGDALRRQRWPEEEGEEEAKEEEKRWPERAPESWREAAAVTARTAGLAYAETLGKWALGDIAFGINRLMRIQVCFLLIDHEQDFFLTCTHFVLSLFTLLQILSRFFFWI